MIETSVSRYLGQLESTDCGEHSQEQGNSVTAAQGADFI